MGPCIKKQLVFKVKHMCVMDQLISLLILLNGEMQVKESYNYVNICSITSLSFTKMLIAEICLGPLVNSFTENSTFEVW